MIEHFLWNTATPVTASEGGKTDDGNVINTSRFFAKVKTGSRMPIWKVNHFVILKTAMFLESLY